MYPYISLTEKDEREMLDAIGLKSLDDLFGDVPKGVALDRDLDLPEAKSEMEVASYLTSLSKKNTTVDDMPCFLGAGAYDHYIPSVIRHILMRGEFLTSYTPYQPEISQGTLQYIFEFQTMMTNLTGMDFTNASLYDGGSSIAEAALMAVKHARKGKVLVSKGVSAQSRTVLETYCHSQSIEVEEVELKDGVVSKEDLESKLGDDIGAFIVQSPNFLGNIEDVKTLAEITHKIKKSYFIMSTDPLTLGILKKPRDLGVDVVVGEAQSLGLSLAYGGPYLGFLSTNKEFLRKIPGRIVGQTEDLDGKRSWVLTLAAREQHIRRDKATSNICSNQGLNVLNATIYMALMGKKGIKEVAAQSAKKAHYAYDKLLASGKYEKISEAPFFMEFAVKCPKPVEEINKKLLENGIIGGYDLKKDYPELGDVMLLAFTEKRTKEEIDKLCSVMEEV